MGDIAWSSLYNDYTKFSGKRIPKSSAIEIVADYTEDQDWRKHISSQIGTESAFYNVRGGGVHWVSKWPSEDFYWDSTMWEAKKVNGKDVRIQHYIPYSRMNDTYCSLYSLYHELDYDHILPKLKVSSARNEEMKKAFEYNKILLKSYLPLVCGYIWSSKFNRWYDKSVEDQKKEFLHALSNL